MVIKVNMLVVMQFHGVSFGPSLFQRQPEVGYGMFMAMAVTYAIMEKGRLKTRPNRIRGAPTTYYQPSERRPHGGRGAR